MRWMAGIPILLTLTSVNAVTQAPGSGPSTTTIMIPAGTILPLKFQQSYRATRDPQGAPIRLETREAVAVNGATVIPKGTRVDGAVEPIELTVQQKPRTGLRLELNHILFDGYAVDVTAPLGSRPTAVVKIGRTRARKAFIQGVGPAVVLFAAFTAAGAAYGNPGAGAGIGTLAAGAAFGAAALQSDYSLYVHRRQKVDIVLEHPLELDLSRMPRNR